MGRLALGKPQYFVAGRRQVVDETLHAREVQAVVHAADWAEMLMRMYIRRAEQHNYPVEVFDTSYAAVVVGLVGVGLAISTLGYHVSSRSSDDDLFMGFLWLVFGPVAITVAVVAVDYRPQRPSEL